MARSIDSSAATQACQATQPYHCLSLQGRADATYYPYYLLPTCELTTAIFGTRMRRRFVKLDPYVGSGDVCRPNL